MSHRLIVLLSLAAVAACGADPQTRANRAIKSGDAFVAQHKLREASIEYRNALQAQPQRADVHFKLADVYLQSGDPARAYGEYARASDLDASNVAAHLQAGMLLLQAGQFADAQ